MWIAKTGYVFVAAMLLTGGVQADPIYWNTWNSTSSGTLTAPGGDVAVTFAGPSISVEIPYPSWTPTATFADGVVVGNAPAPANGIMRLTGGTPTTAPAPLNTVTFATPVVNPVMAIWSLGQGGINASFVFEDVTPIFVAGGPNAEYNGVAISVVGSTVSGREANGTVQFVGTYSSISWRNPVYENWYGFNVGIAAAIPEPETYAMLLAGLGMLGFMARRRTKNAA